ncbi:MAG: hydroxyacid dehydrogenase [Rhodospirillales bacterium]|nr:hydroxyacid dehydrogenase [Rhodospirillales bacterium]MBO6788800.1 hydroxyacid dehydrogenase [Rhodospirillales bacterium]
MTDILITEYMDPGAVERLKSEFDVHYDQDLWDKPDAIAEALQGVPGLIVRNQTQVRGVVVENADVLKCVGRLGVGLDNIDTDACAAKGIDVFPATGANSDSVAELAMGGLYVMFRNAYHVTDETIAGGWPRMRMMGREVMGKTLAIVGFGSIGKALAWRAKGVGMTVTAWDPYIGMDSAVWAEHGVEPRPSLEDVISDADAVSVHVPLNDETRDMFDTTMMSKMKSDAVLFNLARGGIVNEADLVAALKAGTIGGAFLDTFDVEPLTADNVFKDVPNLMLTPHAGARTVEADDRVCNMIADAVATCLRG